MEKRKSDAKGGGSKAKHKSLLHEFHEQRVLLVTFDGRTILGTMRGYDQTCNVVLDKSIERIFTAGESAKEVPLGLFVARGDNVAVVGLLDEEQEAASNWQNAKVPPLDAFVH